MNKNIKKKKSEKLQYKKFLNKDKLFMKKFPRLFVYCTSNNIEYSKIKRAYKRFNKYFNSYDKDYFETTIKWHLLVKHDNPYFIPKKGAYGEIHTNIAKKCLINV